mmetsp:Transcript_32041/g.52511  ORF Transcript_32041/g.52511 Transcript_32041/m.52511 type:complete len:125 (-) Transcript_32041:103-477(-)
MRTSESGNRQFYSAFMANHPRTTHHQLHQLALSPLYEAQLLLDVLSTTLQVPSLPHVPPTFFNCVCHCSSNPTFGPQKNWQSTTHTSSGCLVVVMKSLPSGSLDSRAPLSEDSEFHSRNVARSW